MRNTWMIVLFLCWTTIVNAVRIYPECQPKTKWEQKWRGSETLITAWFDTDSNTEFSAELRIKNKLSELTEFTNSDTIDVGRKCAELYMIRNGKETKNETCFDEPLESGWQQFVFQANSSNMNLWHQSKRIFSWELTNVIEKLEVAPSNVTFNCLQNEFWWPVGTGETPTIPLAVDNHEKEISFYSNLEFQPTLTLSNSKDSVTLGWDGENKGISKENQRFLPAYVKHTLYISCEHNHHEDVECTLKGKVKITTFYVREMPKALRVSSVYGEEFIVLLQIPPLQEQTSAVTAICNVYQEITSTVTTLASEVTSHKNTKDGLSIPGVSTTNLIISSICLTILVLGGITVCLKWKRRKVNESDVSRRDVESGDENERQPLNENSTETNQQQKFDETNKQQASKFMTPDPEVAKGQHPRSSSQLCGSVVKDDTTTSGIKMDPSVKEKQGFDLNETRDGGCSMDKISIENKTTNSQVHKPHVFRRDVESGDENERQPFNENSTETDQQQKFDETNKQSTSKYRIPDQEVDKHSVSQLCASAVKGDTTTNGIKMDPSGKEKKIKIPVTFPRTKKSIKIKRTNSEAQQSRNLAGKKYGSTDSLIGAQWEETENSNVNETKIYFAESGFHGKMNMQK